MGDCPLKSVDWRSSQSTANPDFSDDQPMNGASMLRPEPHGGPVCDIQLLGGDVRGAMLSSGLKASRSLVP